MQYGIIFVPQRFLF